MKTFFAMLSLVALVSACSTQSSPEAQGAAVSTPAVVDAGCGQCLFGMKGGAGCDLAVKVDGKPYFVDGFTMNQFGDAHASDGMCQVVRKAKVTGKVANDRFAASTFEVLPSGK